MNWTIAKNQILEMTGHVAQLVCVHRKEDGTIDAQLTTGNPVTPFIAVNSNIVCESDLLALYDDDLEPVICPLPYMSLDFIDMWGTSFVA